MPGGQGAQLPLLFKENVPGPQSWHAEDVLDATLEEKEPAGHALHTPLPERYAPTMQRRFRVTLQAVRTELPWGHDDVQTEQDVDPGWSAKVPFRQRVHADWPGLLVYLPALHREQAMLPLEPA